MTDSNKNSYMRSVNDYSLSAHEMFSARTGKKYANYTDVFVFENIPDEELEKVVGVAVAKLESDGFSMVEKYNVRYADHSSKRDYSIYGQKFFVLTKGNESIILESYVRGETVVIITLSEVSPDALIAMHTEYKDKFPKEAPVLKNMFFTINRTNSGFELAKMELNVDYNETMIGKSYNDSFKTTHDLVLNSIDGEKSGLILLHGDPGTGKTSYLKQIIARGGKRKLIFIPPYLASSLSDPAFVGFVRKEMSGSVLVIEDAEDVLYDRDAKTGSGSAVSNLLNISNGIMGDALNILIVATFNTDLNNVDKALLRKGRLIAEYKFTELTADKADELAIELYGEDKIVDLSTANTPEGRKRTLANIYNCDTVQPRTADTKRKIGF